MIDSVLIVQSGFLGDAVLATGLVRAISGVSSATRIGMLVRSFYVDLLHGHPGITQVYGMNKQDHKDITQIIEQIRLADYQLALIPHRSLRSQMIPYRAGIPKRVGFRQSTFSFLCTDTVEYAISSHELQRNASLLVPVGLDSARLDYHSWLSPDPETLLLIQEKYNGEKPTIVVAPGSVWPTKCWPEEGYAQLCQLFIEREWAVYLVGSKQERELCIRIAERARLERRYVLAGTLSLAELVAVMKCADRVVTNDSAPLHIAEGVATPVTAIFGPTAPEFGFSPYLPRSALLERPLPCRPCGIHGHRTCPLGTHRCMEEISVQAVFEAAINVENHEGIP